MATIHFEISNLQKVIDATKWFLPIPQIDNPAFVTTEITPEEEPRINEFTDNQWAKEAWRRFIIEKVKDHEEYLARKAIDIQSDDTLLT